jgi:hypothetical protein
MHSPLSVLICSSDRYHSLWPLQLDAWANRWPDCPYPVYLGADSIPCDRVTTLTCTEKGLSWSSCLLEWLEAIDSDYVLLTLDDFILRRPVDTSTVSDCLQFIEKETIDCLRLVMRPKPFYPAGDRRFGKYDPALPYLVSLQASIWKKSALLALLRHGESIWEFEQYGTIRAREAKLKFYGVYQTVFNYGEHIIDGGHLLRTSTQTLPLEKYSLNFPTLPLKLEAVILIKRLFHFVAHRLPVPLRLIVINHLVSKLKSNTIQYKTSVANQFQ